jgi:hypothetical protein
LSKKLPRQNPTQGAGEIIKNREAEWPKYITCMYEITTMKPHLVQLIYANQERKPYRLWIWP